MSTDIRTKPPRTQTWDRSIYRLTVDQVLKMVECGILPEGGHVELWDGVLYEMTKGEIHNAVVGEVADQLRPLIPAGYFIREEKSNRYGDHSLPEPDVSVCRGKRFDYGAEVAPLSALALVVEVSLTSGGFDSGERLRRYAEVRIPVYWIVNPNNRTVAVHTGPQGTGKEATYEFVATYHAGEAVPVVIDGHEVGRIAVNDLFPPPKA